jgi:hypothetical protein
MKLSSLSRRRALSFLGAAPLAAKSALDAAVGQAAGIAHTSGLGFSGVGLPSGGAPMEISSNKQQYVPPERRYAGASDLIRLDRHTQCGRGAAARPGQVRLVPGPRHCEQAHVVHEREDNDAAPAQLRAVRGAHTRIGGTLPQHGIAGAAARLRVATLKGVRGK